MALEQIKSWHSKKGPAFYGGCGGCFREADYHEKTTKNKNY